MVESTTGLGLTTNSQWIEASDQWSLNTWHKFPIVPARGLGCSLWDVEGNEFLDMMSGQLCVSVGHSHPRLLDAVSRQSALLMQTGSSFTTPQEVELSRRLTELTPGDLQKPFYGCTGSDSVETAIRIARFATGRHEMVALSESYHGLSLGSWSVTGRGYRRGHPEYGPATPGVTFIPTPNPYRCRICSDEGCASLACFEYSVEMIDLNTTGEPAAVIIEPVLGGPIVVPPAEYIQALRHFCTERGALLIMDEALTGLGRTGKWFAAEHHNVVPDIMTLSKSLGGAVPLSATLASESVTQGLEEGGYSQSTSHSGDPFLCGVGLANLDIIENEGLVERAEVMGEYFKTGLENLKDQYEIVGDVRGVGLLLGMEIVTDKASAAPAPDLMTQITGYCLDKGLILFTTPGTPIIRIAPPLVIGESEIDRALTVIENAIRAVSEGAGR